MYNIQWKRISLLAIGLIMVVALVACGATPSQPAAEQPAAEEPAAEEPAAEEPAAEEPAAEEGALKIGFSVYDMQYGFFQDMEAGTREAAEAQGYEYVLVDQKSSESTMVSATEDLLNQGIDALIISPVKPEALGPIVDAAKAKGIPVVINDIGGGGTDYDVIVISDNYKGGVLAAEEMDQLITAKGSAKKVASITCGPSAVYAARRNQGFEAKIKELGYEVVATLSGHSKQEEGYKIMSDILVATPDVAGVFSCNDPMAVGAAQAIADAGKSGAEDVFVIGFNADEIALEAIKAGQMIATVQQVPYIMGEMTVDLATQLINGETLDYDNPDEREIFVPVKMITAEPAGDAGAGDVCQGQDGSGLKVGFGNLGEQVPFAVQVRESIESIAAECGLEIVNADNALDPQIAVDNARLFMTQEVDGIIQFNVHGNIADSICEIAAGTPMIAIDIAHEACSVFMGANNRGAGELGGIAAGEMAKELWDCKIDAIVTHESPGVGQVNTDRLNGQVAGLQSVCPDNDYGDFENWSMDPVGIITRLDSDRVDPGFEKGRDYLTANQDKEHIVALCINDDACLGMLAATQEAGRDGQVIYSTQGADKSSWVEIRNNPMWAGSVAYFPERYGEFLVPNIIRLINGEETEDPILMEHVSINADNIDEWYPEE